MKKLNLLFTALLLMCCVGNAKAEKVTIDGIKYDVITKAKQAKVISGDTKYSGDIVIPSEITYNNVTYSVTSIGNSAFFNCYGLTSITIPNSVTSIGEWAFRDCDGLKTVYNCSNLTFSIGSYDYGYIAYYANTVYNANNGSIEGDYIFGKPNDINTLILYLGNETELTLPADYKGESYVIGASAFNGNKTITSVEIPNSVTSIGDWAFSYCDRLTSVTIGNSVTSIGEWAFYCCSALTNITIPNSVTSIGDDAFNYCSGLKEVHINDIAAWCSIDFGSTDANPLYYAHNLYLNNELITELVIPNGVKSIGWSAFYNCKGLTSITIPNSVTSIGKWALANCENLTDVYCLATNVPDTPRNDWGESLNPFDGSYPEYMTLHVPAASINNYKTTAPWSSFGNIVTLDGEIVEPEVKICATPTISYNNGKLSFECETEGAEFTTDVTCSDINKFYDSEINFSATYNISVYATAAGYENSDIVNATLCWIECDCDADDNTDIINIPAKAVLVTSNNGTINICCSLEGENVAVYSSNAMFIGSTTIENGCASIQSGLSKGDIAIVKIGEKSIKVILN